MVFWKGKWKDRGIRFRQKDFACNSGGLYHECSNHRRDSEKAGNKSDCADQDQPEAGVQEGVKEKKETKEVVEQNGDSPYLEMGLIYYVAWEDYVNSLDSLDKEMQETEFSDAYRVVIASLEEGSIQQEDGLSAEDAVKKY